MHIKLTFEYYFISKGGCVFEIILQKIVKSPRMNEQPVQYEYAV